MPALRRARDESDAVVELFREAFPSLVRYMTRRVLDAELGVELAAEAFAHILEKSDQFAGTTLAEQEAWMFRVARTQLSRYVRERHIERRALERLRVDPGNVSLADIEEIENAAGLAEIVGALRDAVAALPVDQQTAIRLRVIEELDYAEVAARMGVSDQAARARVSRGLRRLAQELDHEQVAEALA